MGERMEGDSLVPRPFLVEEKRPGKIIPKKVGIPDIFGFYPFIKPYSTCVTVISMLHRILSQHISPSRIQNYFTEILWNLTRMGEQIVPGRF